MSGTPSSAVRQLFAQAVRKIGRPLARRVLYRTVQPTALTAPIYSGFYQLGFLGRELGEWARRSLWATPVFLSQCAVHGEDISVERVPYMTGPCRIELGSRIRFGGLVLVLPSSRGEPTLHIADGVFVGHLTTFAVARRIEIGRYVSIGEMCYIADTEGHSHYNPNRPIWEVPASDDDVGEVVIEDNVQISRGCQILKGVRIGARSVIGAGAVVRSDIPPDSVVMGNPGRVVKRMQPSEGEAGATK